MKELNFEQLSSVNGGCAACKEAGKAVGKFVRRVLFVDEIKEFFAEEK